MQIANKLPESSDAEGSGTKTFQNLPSCWGYHMSLFFRLRMWFLNDFSIFLLVLFLYFPQSFPRPAGLFCPGVFDFFVVLAAVVDLCVMRPMDFASGSAAASNGSAAFSAFRVLQLFRLARIFQLSLGTVDGFCFGMVFLGRKKCNFCKLNMCAHIYIYIYA